MKVKVRFWTITLILVSHLFIANKAIANPTDSVGTKVKNGKLFILHKVESGQGLFSISRRYSIPLKKILKANPGADKKLLVDQIIFVPTNKTPVLEKKEVKEYFAKDKTKPVEVAKKEIKSTFGSYHSVVKGETLYSISTRYNTKPEVLISLNNLTDLNLSIDQKLLVPSAVNSDETLEEKEQRLERISEKLEQVKKETKLQKTMDGFKNIDGMNYSKKSEYIKKYDVEKVSEKGICEKYTNDSEKENRVASHHSAEIGSTIMVVNPDNNKAVFVRIVANHEVAKGKGNIILLTPAALLAISLSPNEPIELNYAK